MPKPAVRTFPQVYAAVSADLMTRIGDAMAAHAGPPISEDVEPTTDSQRTEAWWARRPEATDEAMLQLAQQKYAEHTQAGMPPEKAQQATAEDLTHFRYGQRLKLYSYGQVGFRQQVAEAKRLAKVAARESTPTPEPAPPTMPSAAMTRSTPVGRSGQAAAAQPSPAAGTVLGKPTGGPPDLSPPPAVPDLGGYES